MRHTIEGANGMRRAATAVQSTAKRSGGVWDALCWAFGVELASVDFEDELVQSQSVGMEWVMMQRAQLGGVRIDGGGRSSPHDDADLVAAAVASLPSSYGGRGMAVWIAELARAGRYPDWMPGAAPRCVPRAWRQTKHGVFAATEACGTDMVTGRRGTVTLERRMCPVTYHPSGAQIAARRRAYLDWWGALLWLRPDLERMSLGSWTLTNAMPPMTPWKNSS